MKGDWASNPGNRVPGPSDTNPPDAPLSVEFSIFPTVHDIPFNYIDSISEGQ